MFKKELLTGLMLCFVMALGAQDYIERCHTMEVDKKLRKEHPELGTLEDQEQRFSNLLRAYKRNNAEKSLSGVVTLPVIFHIVHNGGSVGSGDNISATYVNAQITQLNYDFRKVMGTSGFNTNPVGADVEVQFCPALVDPSGVVLVEPGIHRINRNTAGWSSPPFTDTYIDATIKPQSIWDPTKYINIWVLNIGDGLLGYAQFPNSSTSSSVANTDGVVILYSSVGSSTTPYPGAAPYDQGRTLTHEIGHFLNLYHTFQGGCSATNDLCDDTPKVSSPSFGCQIGRTTCSGVVAMVENYMDYSDDGCMNIFTIDQKDRVRTAIMNFPRRMELLNSTVCNSDPCAGETIPPSVTKGSIGACYTSIATAQAAALAATTATDNCPGTLTKTATTSGTCAATITVTVTDANSNSASVTYNTRIDNTPPTLVCRTASVFLSPSGTYTLQQADVLNAGSSFDNCGGYTVTNIQPGSVNCAQVGTVVPVVVTAIDECGLTSTCTAQITVQKGTGLPAPYLNNEVGASGQTPGTAAYDPCTQLFTVTSSGFSTNMADDAHFAYANLCGNAVLTAHVLSVNNGWGGIMMRESLMPGSKKVALKVDFAPSGSNSLIREVRLVTNGIEQQQSFPIAPGNTWLRLTRSGNIFQGWTSADGVSWDLRFTVTNTMSNCLLSGMFTEAYNVNTVATAQFGSVSMSSNAPLVQYSDNDRPVEVIQPRINIPMSPNPTTGLITADFSNLIDQALTIQVFNAYGQQVWIRKIEQVADDKEILDLSAQQTGIYWVNITFENVERIIQCIALVK